MSRYNHRIYDSEFGIYHYGSVGSSQPRVNDNDGQPYEMCLGIPDENGNPIYENDIVGIRGTYRSNNQEHYYIAKVIYDKSLCSFVFITPDDMNFMNLISRSNYYYDLRTLKSLFGSSLEITVISNKHKDTELWNTF